MKTFQLISLKKYKQIWFCKANFYSIFCDNIGSTQHNKFTIQSDLLLFTHRVKKSRTVSCRNTLVDISTFSKRSSSYFPIEVSNPGQS